MSLLHDEKNRIDAILTKDLEENIATIGALFKDCADAVKRKMSIGGVNKVDIYVVYIDNMINKALLEEVTVN
ncbi:MAG: hypothetical protein K0S41_1039, partial [Anaerocolumna sp.]|nr:hypothetical protein [Anaerocolumna sp.]